MRKKTPSAIEKAWRDLDKLVAKWDAEGYPEIEYPEIVDPPTLPDNHCTDVNSALQGGYVELSEASANAMLQQANNLTYGVVPKSLLEKTDTVYIDVLQLLAYLKDRQAHRPDGQ